MADPKTTGWKTTEFWTLVIYSVLAVLNASGVLPFKIDQNTMDAIAAPVVTYIVSRIGLKAANTTAQAKVTVAQTENPVVNSQ